MGLVLASLTFAQVPDSVYDRAVADLDQQKYPEAEGILRPALAEQPRDARALGLMGVILDAQERYEEAEKYYNRALEIEPSSASLLNNLGNHYLARTQPTRARSAFLRVIAIEPNHSNANLQLAQMSADAKQGKEALRFLSRLPAPEQAQPAAQLLKAQALACAGQQALAEDLLARLEKQAAGTPGLEYSAGLLLAGWGRYGEAETAFSNALRESPANFEVLYNLGLAAQKAAHLERARQVFEAALQQRPNDPDCLFNLALISTAESHADKAVILLLQAHNAAPQRTDILDALAKTSEQLGLYSDAASALDLYLKLRPQDAPARRERGFARALSGDLDPGLEDLRWYVQTHANEARGLYELAVAETAQQPEKALEHLQRALELDPQMTAARYARAVLCYQKGQFQESLEDLRLLLKAQPDDAIALDMAGEDLIRLHRPAPAAQFLSRAAQLRPADSKILLHYSQALLREGRTEEAEKVIADFKALEPRATRERAQASLFEFLDLPPEEQFSRYTTNLQRAINARPDDPLLKVRLGQAYLEGGKVQEAIAAFRAALQQTSNPAIVAACGVSLLDRNQYAAATEFLERAAAGDSSKADVRIGLATAVFHSQGPEAGMRVLDAMPPGQRQGDYHLLRAQLLAALKRPREAAEALNQGIRSTPTRPDLYFQAALFMIDHNQVQEMLDFLASADRVVPNNPQLWLTRAVGLAVLRQTGPAAGVLTKIETQWPEWYLPYLIHGVILSYALRGAEAIPLLQTAIALGARQPTAYYNLAYAFISSDPENVADAQASILEAIVLKPKDPYIQSLAGRIAYRGKDYSAALEHLHSALEIWPDMIEAHETLSATYRALGDKDQSAEELKTVVRIKQQHPGSAQIPVFPTNELLFTVGEPANPSP